MEWSDVIRNMKFREQRIFNKEDKERKRPFKFNHHAECFVTGENTISIYSMKDEKNYTMSYDYFVTFFEIIEVEV
jgi:hypothetical protein